LDDNKAHNENMFKAKSYPPPPTCTTTNDNDEGGYSGFCGGDFYSDIRGTFDSLNVATEQMAEHLIGTKKVLREQPIENLKGIKQQPPLLTAQPFNSVTSNENKKKISKRFEKTKHFSNINPLPQQPPLLTPMPTAGIVGIVRPLGGQVHTAIQPLLSQSTSSDRITSVTTTPSLLDLNPKEQSLLHVHAA
jgi:hypothetical protein